MDENKELILNDINQYKDTLVLNYLDLYRLLDFAEDDEDYYYVLENCDGQVRWSSCVVRFIPLKGFLKDDDYNKLESIWNFNYKIKERVSNELDRLANGS